MAGFARTQILPAATSVVSLRRPATLLATMLLAESSGRRAGVYNILWALVFGFATLNILSLVAKRFEPNRNRMSFGEIAAVMTVVVSVFLLGWEMLGLLKILPLRLPSR